MMFHLAYSWAASLAGVFPCNFSSSLAIGQDASGELQVKAPGPAVQTL